MRVAFIGLVGQRVERAHYEVPEPLPHRIRIVGGTDFPVFGEFYLQRMHPAYSREPWRYMGAGVLDADGDAARRGR